MVRSKLFCFFKRRKLFDINILDLVNEQVCICVRQEMGSECLMLIVTVKR